MDIEHGYAWFCGKHVAEMLLKRKPHSKYNTSFIKADERLQSQQMCDYKNKGNLRYEICML